ncbi:hypothetical protein [Chryseobacterium gleum]|uniref:hypothetical protein n=1 Tax=Chryseobacterium gleum TaxID=250 RepID=UPI00241C854E|nr:hypothetical protein [Chryseobacterium gleum]
MSDKDKLTVIDRDLVENIKSIILSSRKSLSQRVNQELIFTYWRIDKEIVDTEQKNNLDNQSSRQIIFEFIKTSYKGNWKRIFSFQPF